MGRISILKDFVSYGCPGLESSTVDTVLIGLIRVIRVLFLYIKLCVKSNILAKLLIMIRQIATKYLTRNRLGVNVRRAAR